MSGTAIRLAKSGFDVYGIDYQGHGKSSGSIAHIENFNLLVDDCYQYFTYIAGMKQWEEQLTALHLHLKDSKFWNGAILVAPMCKVSGNLKPNPLFLMSLQTLSIFTPKWKVCPTSVDEIIDLAYKEPKARREVRENKYCYKGRPSLKTGEEILKTCSILEKKLHEVQLPFLILQGGDDHVVDVSSSEHLYIVASSSDKSFKVYPKMWHSILHGEPLENINRVFSDIINWLDERIPQN
ncbi:hypothetical protein ACFE04_030102 [Oxalis oulophora]